MKRQIQNALVRYLLSTGMVVAVVFFYKRVFAVNPTTVGFTLLVAILLVSAYWGFRLAVFLSIVATAAFNFFFFPPFGTFTINDPQNWVALFSFLTAALVASDLSERAHRAAEHAQQRRMEVERLYSFSQQLLTADYTVRLLNSLPSQIAEAFGLSSTSLIVAGQGTIYRSSPAASVDTETLDSVLARGEPVTTADASYVPLRIGVRTIGALGVVGTQLATGTLEAIGSLVGIAIERARAVEELTRNQAMQENERLRSALLDSVTHEFRTPLTGIKASVTSLQSGHGLNDEQRQELMTIIDEEADRLNRLVGEAAEMAQLDSQSFQLDLQSHRMGDVVEAAMHSARAALQGHRVEVNVPNTLPEVRFDFERIREVLLHLLENAGKYSPLGTPIRVSAEVKGREVITSVADRGPGIDPFEQALIFDKFYRGRNHRITAHGTGMGLAIAKVIVEAHHGRIEVVSQLEEGAVFSFSLPLAEVTSR